MANKRKLTVDKTYLSLDQAESRGFIHRDYIAHCLRWTHFIKSISEGQNYKTARILDIGCGRELPLAKTLYSSRLIPASYVGVDVGPINDDAVNDVAGAGKKFPCVLWDNSDFAEEGFLEDERFDFITCFEVLEHVEPEHMCRMLLKMKRLLAPGGQIFISTPCWNRVDCAANHVDEMMYETLGAVFEDLGFTIDRVHGTFASQRDYKPLMNNAEEQVYNILSQYYDSNFLSCVFAPIFPSRSRNALWVLSAGAVQPHGPRLFKPLQSCPTPLGSSSAWSILQTWYPKILASSL